MKTRMINTILNLSMPNNWHIIIERKRLSTLTMEGVYLNEINIKNNY
jgi:hypothetical protein